jgi:hypothetical protein
MIKKQDKHSLTPRWMLFSFNFLSSIVSIIIEEREIRNFCVKNAFAFIGIRDGAGRNVCVAT